MSQDSPAFDRYLERALEKIRHEGLHREIAAELRSHLVESQQAGIRAGLEPAQAAAAALEQMGDPDVVGQGLSRVHRPRIHAGILAAALALSALGVWTASASGRLPAQLVFSLLGLGLGAGLTFTDYAVLKRLALPSYLATAAVLLGALIGGPRYQGQPYLFLGGLRIKLIDACPLLFTITLAGLASRARWQSRKAGAGLTLAVGIAEVLLCAGGSLTALILFLVGIAAVLLASHARGWQTAAIGTVGIALSATFWRPDVFVGAGAAAAVRLAEAHTDYVFAALLGTPGRVVAALAACLALFLLGQLAEAIRAIRAETPRLVSVGVTALFAAEVAWSLLANLGWAPMPAAGLGFPFLSFGGTLLVVHAASLGLVLGAYRRKTLQTV